MAVVVEGGVGVESAIPHHAGETNNRRPARCVIGRLRHWLDAGEASRLQPACHCFLMCFHPTSDSPSTIETYVLVNRTSCVLGSAFANGLSQAHDTAAISNGGGAQRELVETAGSSVGHQVSLENGKDGLEWSDIPQPHWRYRPTRCHHTRP